MTEGLPLARVRRTITSNLAICGSHIDLAGAELELLGTVGREVILRDQINADTEAFDFVLMDCPPSLSVLTLNALCAATEVLIPLQAHFLALHGLSKLLETVNLVSKRVNRELKVGGIVLCLYDAGTRHGSEVIEDLNTFFDGRRKADAPWADARLYQTRIRRNIRLAECPSFGQSIFQYAPTSRGAEDYSSLAAEIQGLPAASIWQGSDEKAGRRRLGGVTTGIHPGSRPGLRASGSRSSPHRSESSNPRVRSCPRPETEHWAGSRSRPRRCNASARIPPKGVDSC